MALMLSLGVSAQTASSADAAIGVAEQWLGLADADQGGAMWDQSFSFMKEKESRTAWITYVSAKKSLLGTRVAPRVWARGVLEQGPLGPGWLFVWHRSASRAATSQMNSASPLYLCEPTPVLSQK
ncbi:MAG: DUF4019 domain-containing protein [Polaromonas sp.]|nr:DUF4019 domain-containing protein [Polaromonas sp.]